MARKNTGEAALRWREILKRQAGSGLSIREFCATEGVSQPSFYAWRRRLRERKDNGSHPRAARRAKDAPDQERMFVPLELLGAAQSLEIIHPHGYRVQIGGEVNPVSLRQVIQVLDERGAR
jgi:putative transposase